MSVTVRTLIYVVVLYIVLTYDQHPEEFELDMLRKRINGYRRVAEFCGRRVITLENKYATAIESGRMN